MFKFFTSQRNYQWLNSLLIAISAALLCKETFIVAQINYQDYRIYMLVFFATLYAYLNYPGEKNFSAKQFFDFIKLKKTIGNPFFDTTIGLILLLFFISNWQTFAIIMLITGCSLLYFGIEIPYFNFKIRKLYFAKPIILALVWAITTVLLPLAFAHQNLLSTSAFFIFMRRLFFIAALIIPFEIRDRQKDAAAGDNSFVNLIGIKNSKILAMSCMVIFLLLALVQFKAGAINGNVTIAMAVSFLLSVMLILIYKTDQQNSGLVLFFIDGMLMAQFFLIVGTTAMLS